jgi:hypothetical protein
MKQKETMSYDIETIVRHLNEEPFNLNIRLVSTN